MSAPEALLTPKQAAAFLAVARSTLLGLVEREGLPVILLGGGGGRRRILRFQRQAIERWFAGRDERRVKALLDGRLYRHRRVVGLEGGGDQDRSP